MAAIISRSVPLNSSIPLVNLKTADYGLFLSNPKSDTAPPLLGLGISFRAIGDKISQVATPVKLATVNALIQACAPPSQNPALAAVCGAGTTSSNCDFFSLGSVPGVNSGSVSQTVQNGFAYIDIAVDPMFANSSLVECVKNNAGNSLQGALNNAEAAKRGSSVTSGTSTLASKKGVLLSAVLASACYVLAAA